MLYIFHFYQVLTALLTPSRMHVLLVKHGDKFKSAFLFCTYLLPAYSTWMLLPLILVNVVLSDFFFSPGLLPSPCFYQSFFFRFSVHPSPCLTP